MSWFFRRRAKLEEAQKELAKTEKTAREVEEIYEKLEKEANKNALAPRLLRAFQAGGQ